MCIRDRRSIQSASAQLGSLSVDTERELKAYSARQQEVVGRVSALRAEQEEVRGMLRSVREMVVSKAGRELPVKRAQIQRVLQTPAAALEPTSKLSGWKDHVMAVLALAAGVVALRFLQEFK
eukprot:TRINITY_DN27859_c0_g1_i2.p1 TRINITY_DN27859_c0_g1~~TRINITY_DN27859_c0_g1_i2.p1  ORF type:complete len:122 (-),score=40.99 TRINITY_DN27859_c0_g1_i2:210-575(-)